MTTSTDDINFKGKERFHNFKSWSQLADESKGGYLKGFIQIAPEVRKVKLALYEKDGSPHPCLLFVTPLQKEKLGSTQKKVRLLRLSKIYRLSINITTVVKYDFGLFLTLYYSYT